MLTLYLVCLIVGGLLAVTLSIFAGSDGEPVAEPSPPRWFTLRNLIFFAAFFGLASGLVTTAGVQPLLTRPVAFVCGTAAAAGVHYLMQQVGDNERSGSTNAVESAPATPVEAEPARAGAS